LNLVIVTIHLNNYDGLLITFESIKRFASKGHDFIWVIKDGESDLDIIQKIEQTIYKSAFEIKFIVASDKGIYDAMNQSLIEIDNLNYVLFLNSGDQLTDDFVKQFTIDDIRGFDLIFSDTILLESKKLVPSPHSLDFSYFIGKTINHQSIFLRSEILKRHLFKTEFSIVADWIQLFEIMRTETVKTKKLDYPISIYEGGGISEKQNELRVTQRKVYLESIYTSWELDSLKILARIRQRPWYGLLIKSLDSSKRSYLLSLLSKLFK